MSELQTTGDPEVPQPSNESLSRNKIQELLKINEQAYMGELLIPLGSGDDTAVLFKHPADITIDGQAVKARLLITPDVVGALVAYGDANMRWDQRITAFMGSDTRQANYTPPSEGSKANIELGGLKLEVGGGDLSDPKNNLLHVFPAFPLDITQDIKEQTWAKASEVALAKRAEYTRKSEEEAARRELISGLGDFFRVPKGSQDSRS